MSKIIDTAEALKAHLETIIAQDELFIVVDKQKDISAEVQKNLAKVKGGAASIEYVSMINTAGVGDDLNMKASYVISLVTKPILRTGNTPTADLLERIVRAVNGWQVDTSRPCSNSALVKSVNLVPNPQFLIHQIKIEKKILL